MLDAGCWLERRGNPVFSGDKRKKGILYFIQALSEAWIYELEARDKHPVSRGNPAAAGQLLAIPKT
jgi:hypothetical protein